MKNRAWFYSLILLMSLPIFQYSRTLTIQQVKGTFKTQKPDLIIRSINIRPPTPCVNAGTDFHMVVENIGNAIAPESVLGIRIGGAGIKTMKVTAINPSAVRSIYVNKVKLPTAMTYVVTVWADYGNKVKESNEKNNKKVKYIRAIHCRPDLKIEAIALIPGNPTSAQNFTCEVRIINDGSDICGPTTGAMKIGGSAKLITFPVPELMPRSFHGFKKVLYINRAGRYRITAWVDHGNRVSEGNENNNSGYRTFRVSGPSGAVSLEPDLVVSKLRMFPHQPTSSDNIKWHIIVRNNGTALAKASSLRVLVTGIGSLGVFSVPALKPGHTRSFYPERTISQPGKYQIHAYADYKKQVRESIEFNNRKHLRFTVVK